MEVDLSWVKGLVEVLISDPKVGAIQPKILIAYKKCRIESVGHYVDYCGIESWASAKIFNEIDRGQYDRIREVFYAKGLPWALNVTYF
jgi:GT2 family glycosyltransferase